MPARITTDLLTRHAGVSPGAMSGEKASDACAALQGLARWWLRPGVLRRADADDPSFPAATSPARPHLPVTAGSCWVALVVKRRDRWPGLRRAFPLPLQWREGPPGSLLPQRLRRLSEGVARQLRVKGWGVHLHAGAVPSRGGLDLSPLDADLDPPSAWAALAGGLLVATRGGTPDPAVWATGSWRPGDGVIPVGGLRAKVRLATRHAAEVLYVPAAQVEPARRWAAGTGLQVAALRQGTIDPFAALGNYVARLDAPPPPPISAADEEGFQAGVRYYHHQPRGAEPTARYYWKNLLPTITERSRARLDRRLAAGGPGFAPTHLVTIFSGSPELATLMPAVLQTVTNVLLLYTPDRGPPGQAHPPGVRDQLAAGGKCCVLGEFPDDETQAEAIPALVRAFLAGVPADKAVYDLTPGTGWMRWLADRAMPPGSWRVYLRTESKDEGSRPRAGTEDPIPWRT